MIKLLYISTNRDWSGSEELWARSSRLFSAQGFAIASITSYAHEQLRAVPGEKLLLLPPSAASTGLPERVWRKIVKPKDKVRQFIEQYAPDFVIVSQGNNYESLEVMQLLGSMSLPFVTVTQLASESFFWAFTNDRLLAIQQAYRSATCNYFVSEHNKRLTDFMLGGTLSNAEVIYNPCKIAQSVPAITQPPSGVYQVALVGRLDCWHKGYDLFLQVIGRPEWKKRPVLFNIYGTGPHSLLMEQQITHLGIQNVRLHGHQADVAAIWAANQLLVMPSRMEGQALALIEAMACARTAVVTDVGGATELIEDNDNGFVAAAATTSSIAEALERAWAGRADWHQLGQKAAATLAAKYPADAVEYFNASVANYFKTAEPA
ncbi:glycosyltransferase family 4 protein [Hymenobacter rubripertinctus]|uniref:Glycosyltransferase n=2 Tax=Hymenobacter rubripertinctus TaxID=2029981 RepID=A0A418QWB8_9BACT|nr:glycosyltransferase family 4 protein [Hymenobacter rubripertinctus]RIY09515.1 glycosyltransferase [Hymenobacter rubripertinctus]